MSQAQHAETIFFNGRIHTMDPQNLTVSALAVSQGKIVQTGTDKDIFASYTSEHVVDLRQSHVFPGFIDAHAHLFGLGEESVILALQGTTSKREVLSLLAARAATTESGRWIRGRGWDQNNWEEKEYPEKSEIDAITSSHPVLLSRIDGHAAWVNSLALSLAGITAETEDPDGGKILRDSHGNPTGILMDNAIDLVRNIIPLPSLRDMESTYRFAIESCLRVGLTGIHDMGLDSAKIQALKSLIAKEQLPFRIVGYLDQRGDEWDKLLQTGRMTFGNHQLTLAGLKLYTDGALGSRGALLTEDYSDNPGNRGIQITESDTIWFEAERAVRRGLQVCVHAIGDSANHLVLNAFEKALSNLGTGKDKLRIEHAQCLRIEDIPRFAALGIIPSMQPTHCTSDMYWVESRLGYKRTRGAYAWRSLLSTGAWIAGGSDFPVERPNPLWGIYAACTRKNHAGMPSCQEDIALHFQVDPSNPDNPNRYENGWYGSESMSRVEAVKAFTIWAAKAADQDDLLGSIESGKYADFVLLSQDILTIPAKELLNTEILATYIGGKCVFSRK